LATPREETPRLSAGNIFTDRANPPASHFRPARNGPCNFASANQLRRAGLAGLKASARSGGAPWQNEITVPLERIASGKMKLLFRSGGLPLVKSKASNRPKNPHI